MTTRSKSGSKKRTRPATEVPENFVEPTTENIICESKRLCLIALQKAYYEQDAGKMSLIIQRVCSAMASVIKIESISVVSEDTLASMSVEQMRNYAMELMKSLN